MRLTRSAAGSPEAQAARQKLVELEAWARLDGRAAELTERRRDIEGKDRLADCASATSTTAITRKFNEFKDKYLTRQLLAAYQRETAALHLKRLGIKVAPKGGREGARFTVDLEGRKHVGPKLSEILSEGERRALSLAAFLAEQSIGGGAGCLVFDDPVSSLDFEWGRVIARRLVEEAKTRQIIVFTHDLVFYNELCGAADEAGTTPTFHRLFRRPSDGMAGLVDPVRSDWKTQNVGQRIHDIRTWIAKARALADRSPSEYQIQAKEIYGRMRDTWERLVEELLFHRVVQRFQKEVSTRQLKYLTADKAILARIDAGMARTSTYSHDNPAANSDPIPAPDEMAEDLNELEGVAKDLKRHHDTVK